MIYQRFLDMILELRANMNPHSVSCDYEIALFNTVSAGFSNAKIFGCFPHFVKNFKKCINSKHLGRCLPDTTQMPIANFALHARMIPALAFVPVQDLDATFQELSDNSPPEQQPVLDWFEDN